MRKKVLSIMLAVSMVAALLAGCGSTASSGGGKNSLDQQPLLVEDAKLHAVKF